MSNQEETDKQIQDRLHGIFPNRTVANRVIDIATSKKPRGWSHRSHAPYFKEVYANEIKPYIDSMMKNGEDIVYRYSTFCNEQTGMSRQTLYHRVNQSIRFLIECMDDNSHTYAKWYDCVDIHRDSSVGVVIRFRVGFGKDENIPRPELVQPVSARPTWMRRMDEWLEGDSDRPFVIERLALTQDEIVQLKVQLTQLRNIEYSITSTSVKMIRINEQ